MVECQRGATNGNNLILVHYGNGTATDKERYHSRYRRRMGTFAFDAQTSDVPGRAVSHGLGYWMTRSVPRRAQDRRNRRVQPLFMARPKTQRQNWPWPLALFLQVPLKMLPRIFPARAKTSAAQNSAERKIAPHGILRAQANRRKIIDPTKPMICPINLGSVNIRK